MAGKKEAGCWKNGLIKERTCPWILLCQESFLKPSKFPNVSVLYPLLCKGQHLKITSYFFIQHFSKFLYYRFLLHLEISIFMQLSSSIFITWPYKSNPLSCTLQLMLLLCNIFLKTLNILSYMHNDVTHRIHHSIPKLSWCY